jgi:hypothetical protein
MDDAWHAAQLQRQMYQLARGLAGIVANFPDCDVIDRDGVEECVDQISELHGELESVQAELERIMGEYERLFPAEAELETS